MIPQDLHLAYIDPGSGSILIQIIIGTILAVPFVLRRQISRVYEALRSRRWERERHRGNEATAPDR